MVKEADAGLFERFGRTCPVGTILFQEGEPGLEMFVIQSGRVELTRMVAGRPRRLATLPAGEFFGELAIVNRAPRSATATVVEDARLLVIDGRTFEAMVRGNTEIAVRLIRKLAERLQSANEQVEMLLRRDASHRVVHWLRQRAVTDGTPSDLGVRIDVAVRDVAEAVQVGTEEVAACLERLERAHLVHRDLG